MSTTKPHCLLIGIGAGTGVACARRFVDGGYHVSMIARGPERLAGFEAEIPDTTPYAVDIRDLDAFRATLRRMVAAHGTPGTVIYNATLASFGTYLDIDTDDFERNYRVNATGLLAAAQELAPAMISNGGGSIVVTGNTAAMRGKPNFIGWSPSKAGQRILAEALARQLGPDGVHVAYVVIDAVIDMPFARRRWKDQPKDFFAQPDDLAAEIYHVAHQPRTARSFLVELRPFGENW